MAKKGGAMSETKLGHWCKLHGELPFEDDIKLAVEVDSTHELFDGQLIIEIHDPIAGCEVPLWASDADWLYLRRPEGIWKAKLPNEHVWTSATLHVKSPGSETYLPTVIGAESLPSTKWRYRLNKYCQPAEMDRMRAAPAILIGAAMELGRPLVAPPIAENGNLIFKVGTEFDARPDLFYDSKWIFGFVRSDPHRVVAFEHFDDPVILDAFLQGTLRLRFSGDLLLPMDVRVMSVAKSWGSTR
jgi:hypothetical protein